MATWSICSDTVPGPVAHVPCARAFQVDTAQDAQATGAGIAGLAAAMRLTELGVNDITIIEASSHVGGLGKSVVHNGFTFDLGPHQLHTEKPELIAFMERVLGDDLLTCSKKASQWLMGRYLGYPLGISDVLLSLMLGGKSKFGRNRYFTHSPHNRTFFYPRHGIGQLASTMQDYVLQHDVTLSLHTEVNKVILHDKGYTVTTTDGYSHATDRIISTPTCCTQTWGIPTGD